LAEFTKTGVIVLAMNEVQSLADTVYTVLNVCDHKDIEGIVLLLGARATPGCLAMAAQLSQAAADVPITVYLQQEGQKLPDAFFQCSQSFRFSHCLLTSGDGSEDPSAAADFIMQGKKNPGAMISGSRWLTGDGMKEYGEINKIMNLLFQWMVRILYRTKITDVTYGYFLFPRVVLDARLSAEGFDGAMEFKLRLFRKKIPIIEIPVCYRARREGKSNSSFWKKVKYMGPLLRGLRLKK